ncbi:class I SAM-dependent methyltransferase [Pseudorhodoplanes sp.]|uniref:class I SAM-dependent methyltransferase n=1 Tax=Pseudorhodoplanes sp. TaxID=1934341 RepID=UPI003919A7BA
MERLLRIGLTRFIRSGNLRVSIADGKPLEFGDGTGTPVAVRFVSRRALLRLFLNPELRLGEAYMKGDFVLDAGTLADLLALLMSQTPHDSVPYFARPQALVRYGRRRIDQFNHRRRARRNVAHHYDLDGRLYSLFLDADRQYSCAYFERPGQSLDDAQLAKKRHLAAKLVVKNGQRVLDIGSGWGGLALYLADYLGARVTGVTLSDEQLKLARGRAAERQLAGRVDFRLQDYRDVTERFDRIVSVGMFEHVGVGHYRTFFNKCAQLLSDDGVMVLHSIGRSEGPNATNPWIEKYIFPGGYIPALSEVLPAIERAGLIVADIEILRLHYAETLKAWRERFLAHAEEARRLYDDRFVRMWEFYLVASEMAFRHQGLMVFQIQLAKRIDAVPVTRDYIAREEERLRRLERGSPLPLRMTGE